MLHGADWSFFGMHFIWWFLWMAILIGVFTTYTPIPRSHLRTGEGALDILQRRYAAGQVPDDEYARRKAVLQRDEPSRAQATRSRRHR